MADNRTHQSQEAPRGRLLCSDDEGHDNARKVFNGMIDKRPDYLSDQSIGTGLAP